MREFNSLFPVEIRNRNECDLTNAKRKRVPFSTQP